MLQPKRYSPNDAMRIALETDVGVRTVIDILNGGPTSTSRVRSRVYRYLEAQDMLALITPRAGS